MNSGNLIVKPSGNVKELLTYCGLVLYHLTQKHPNLQPQTLTRLSVVLGSWVYKYYEILSGNFDFPNYDKPIGLFMKDRSQFDRLTRDIYWYLRLEVRFPTQITGQDNSVCRRFTTIQNLDELWQKELLILDVSHLDRSLFTEVKNHIERCMVGWFNHRYPIILLGHITQAGTPNDRHKQIGEFIV